MKKPSTVLVSLLILAIFITGCATTNSLRKEEASSTEVNQGKQALTIEFVEKYPPTEVVKGYPEDIEVRATNYGKDPVSATIMIIGVPGGTQTNSVTVAGKEETRTSKEEVDVSFGSASFEYDTSIRATACYAYQTELRGSFCYVTGTEAIGTTCKESDRPNLASGQGAPIMISDVKIEPKLKGEQAIITIDITDVGGGFVRNPIDPTIDCREEEPKTENTDRIKVDEILFGGNVGNCNVKEDGIIRLEGGKGKIVCTFDGLPTSTVPLLLEAKLSYGYITQTPPLNIKVEEIIS